MPLPVSPFVQQVLVEGAKPTYSGGSVVLAASIAPNATDIAQVVGAVGVIVRISRIEVSMDATAASIVILRITKRIAPNVGGTSIANPALIAHDSFDGPASASRRLYTVNPVSLGAGVDVRVIGYSIPAVGDLPGRSLTPEVFAFGVFNEKAIVLRGPNESITLNWGGQAVPAGLRLYTNIEWTEEPN